MEYKFNVINKLKNFFKRKPTIYLLGIGESLETDGNMPIRPVTGLFSRMGDKLTTIVDNTKKLLASHKVINSPEIYSQYPTLTTNKRFKNNRKTPTLLGDGTRPIKKTNLIIPEEVRSNASSVPSHVNETPKKQSSSFPTIPDFNKRHTEYLSTKPNTINLTSPNSHKDLEK